MSNTYHGGYTAANTTGSGGWVNRLERGIMGANASIRIDDIHDGTSNTILVGEIRAGLTSFDCRGVWAMSGACSSALWAHGYYGDDDGPNNTQSDAGDDVVTCTDIYTVLADTNGSVLAKAGMSARPGIGPIGSKPSVACTMAA